MGLNLKTCTLYIILYIILTVESLKEVDYLFWNSRDTFLDIVGLIKVMNH